MRLRRVEGRPLGCNAAASASEDIKDIYYGSPALVRRRFTDTLATRARIAISTIAIYELWYGVSKSNRTEENSARLEAFLAGPLETIALDDDDSRIGGRIRAQLERAGTPIGAYDILIAAQAVRQNAVLVTANVNEFERIAGLRVEDWTR